MDRAEIAETAMEQKEEQKAQQESVSPAVIKRLPRYFRYLRELIREGKTRISSGELSERMHVTASQIRQDLNCFGGFGQQGYGYNVNYLFAKICDILGVGSGYHAIIIDAGDLGRALAKTGMFEKRGVDILALFDQNPENIGRPIQDIPVYNLDTLEDFCAKNPVDIAVLTLPQKEMVRPIAQRLSQCGILGIWNYTGVELKLDREDIAVESTHLGDFLMILNFKIGQKQEKSEETIPETNSEESED